MFKVWRVSHGSGPGRMAALLVSLLCCALLAACAKPRRDGVADLATYPQDAAAYLKADADAPLIPAMEQQRLWVRYRTAFFAPWQRKAASIKPEYAFWGTDTFGKKTVYGENLQVWSRARWESLVGMQMEGAYPSMARRAITTRNTSFRVMPTDKPFFYDPRKPGEGYPFDYLQNSAAWIGTPLLVTHVSADGAWYFAEAGLAYGWLPADAFGWVDDAFCASFMRDVYATMNRDNVPLRDASGVFLGTAHVGALLPLLTCPVEAGAPATALLPGGRVGAMQVVLYSESAAAGNATHSGAASGETACGTGAAVRAPVAATTPAASTPGSANTPSAMAATGSVAPAASGDAGTQPLQVLVPARTVTGDAVLVPARLPARAAAPMPVPLTRRAVAAFANQMMGQPYGWGGLLENRDCSATMHDLFTPFGVWLPRNSSQQGKEGGTLVSLAGESAAKKQETILAQGVPFYSLIWFKGHIGLYLGPDATTGGPLLLHNVWGVRTAWEGEEGRAVIGRLVVTTLRPGEERDDVRPGWLYDKMQGLVVLPGTVSPAP